MVVVIIILVVINQMCGKFVLKWAASMVYH